jgi:hypothetical protein
MRDRTTPDPRAKGVRLQAVKQNFTRENTTSLRSPVDDPDPELTAEVVRHIAETEKKEKK